MPGRVWGRQYEYQGSNGSSKPKSQPSQPGLWDAMHLHESQSGCPSGKCPRWSAAIPPRLFPRTVFQLAMTLALLATLTSSFAQYRCPTVDILSVWQRALPTCEVITVMKSTSPRVGMHFICRIAHIAMLLSGTAAHNRSAYHDSQSSWLLWRVDPRIPCHFDPVDEYINFRSLSLIAKMNWQNRQGAEGV